MQHIRATIASNNEIAEGYFELLFALPANATEPLPGQFLTVRVTDANIPLLRRPFAFSSWDPDSRLAGIIYQKRGNATAILGSRPPGEQLDLLSPLGNFFPAPGTGLAGISVNSIRKHSDREAETERRPVLLAGGIGMGPLFFFAEKLKSEGLDPLLALGARESSLIPDMKRYSSVETIIATDDGSLGRRGTVIDALNDYLATGNCTGDLELYACGPYGMMRAAHDWAVARALPLWVSMEQTMGCAVGACMGCAVEITGEQRYARVCAEGPIFPGGVIKWNR